MTEPKGHPQNSTLDSGIWDVVSSYNTDIGALVQSGLNQVGELLPVSPETILSSAEALQNNIGSALESVSSQGLVPTLWSYTPQVLKNAAYEASAAVLGERPTQILLESARAFYDSESGFGVQNAWNVLKNEFTGNSQDQRQIHSEFEVPVINSVSKSQKRTPEQDLPEAAGSDDVKLSQSAATQTANLSSQISLVQFLADQRRRELSSADQSRQIESQSRFEKDLLQLEPDRDAITTQATSLAKQLVVEVAPQNTHTDSLQMTKTLATEEAIELSESQVALLPSDVVANPELRHQNDSMNFVRPQETEVEVALDQLVSEAFETYIFGAQTLNQYTNAATNEQTVSNIRTELQHGTQRRALLTDRAERHEKIEALEMAAFESKDDGVISTAAKVVVSLPNPVSKSVGAQTMKPLAEKEFVTFAGGALNFCGYAATLSHQQFARIVLRAVLNDQLVNLSNLPNQSRRHSGDSLENQLEQDLVVQNMDRDYHVVVRTLFQDDRQQNQQSQAEEEWQSSDDTDLTSESRPSKTSRDIVVLTVD